MNDRLIITASRGPSHYRHAVNGRTQALRVMAGLRNEGWHDIKATPHREGERQAACLTLVICVVAFFVTVLVYGFYVQLEKRAMWRATQMEVGK